MHDQNPDVTYMIEQTYHYRRLKKHRPDLVERLKRYIAEGRVEVVGGMISTADSNMPCAESLVRTLLMGQRWFKDQLGAEVKTGWLVDAFGSNAQIPQVFASFGQRDMMSTRFGGDKRHDVFYAEGLDGTRMLVAGRDCFSPNLPGPERTRVFFDFVQMSRQVDALFAKARQSKLDGPVMVDVYVEDETYPPRLMVERARELMRDAAASGDEAAFSLPRNFFAELRATGEAFPIESADLNPEFTGTFAQRVEIRLHNRRTEAALLDAEKWLALRGLPWEQKLHDAWWDMGFVHFHDVFTGSHPTRVFDDVLARLDDAREMADAAMRGVFGSDALGCGARTLRGVNGLPYARREWVSVPCACGAACTVSGAKGAVPSYTADGRLWFSAEADACAAAVYTLQQSDEAAPCPPAKAEDQAVLENEHLRLTLDAQEGVSLLSKATQRAILDRVKDLLIVQGDTGSFQIENIVSCERHAWASPVSVAQTSAYTAIASGAFPGGEEQPDTAWQLIFTLRPEDRAIGVQLHVDWRGEGARLRLKLNTTLVNAGDGIYEVPFGVVRRRAYAPGFCRKGEWPAQRFAAIEDAVGGVALINDGVPGVETLGGTMYTTLLRAPTEAYAGMVPDETSSQHGAHDFAFAILPYAGGWRTADVLRAAQRWNEPLRVFAAEAGAEALASQLAISSPTVLLSTGKQPEDADKCGSLLRVAESIGEKQTCTVTLPDAARAYDATTSEALGEAIPVQNGAVQLELAPWQIRTLYVERTNA